MKTKHLYSLILLTAILVFNSYAQVPADSMYFGFDHPGDSAIVFAPDKISLPGRYNQNGSFSPAGDDFCYTVTNSGWTNCTMYYTRYESGGWHTPQIASFVSGIIWDPFFTPDSNHIIYTYSDDLWMLDNESGNWQNPVKIDAPVSSGSAEFSPTVSLDGTIFFFSRRTMDIYSAVKEENQYTTVEKVESPINDFDDREPFIAPDKSYLIFTSYSRSDRFGDGDLYISYKKTNNTWTNPKNLGSKINSNFMEFSPKITPDGKHLMFSRRNSSGSDILWVKSGFIDSLCYTNFIPYLKHFIPNQTDSVNNLFSYTISDSIFIDDDGIETLSMFATLSDDNDLPGWLDFDTVTNTFSGTPTEADAYNIRVTAKDTAGVSISDVFKLTISGNVGIVQTNAAKLSIFPNPAQDVINIQFPNTTSSNFKIFNYTGALVKKGSLDGKECKLDISGLSAGEYVIQILNSNELLYTSQFMKGPILMKIQ